MKHLPLRRVAQGGGLFTDGDWIESPYITDEGFRLIQTGNIGLGAYREQGYRFVSPDTFDALNCTEVRPGDVLICRLADPVGRACLAPDLGTRMITSVDVAILRPNRSVADSRFLNYWFSSAPHLNYVESIARGGTRQRISRDQLGSVPVGLPALPEQRRIVDFLDAETAHLDRVIADKTRLYELILERRASLVRSGVAGWLTRQNPRQPSSLDWLDSIPDHWNEVGLTLVARLGSGHTPSRSRADWWIESECTIPWITTGEVARLRSDRVEYIEETRENISPIGLENSAAEVHPAETVVLCRTASAGYSGIMRSDMATSQDFATWTCSSLLRPRFLLLCLRAMRSDLLGRLAMGSTHKTIYMPDIQSLRIPLPPVDEQDEIVEVVWRQLDRDGHIEDLLTRQIDLLVERRQALITAAVTGELEVADSIAKEAS